MTGPGGARERLVLNLDVGDLDEALPLARRLSPWFAVAKVGYELYAEAGPRAFDALHEAGLQVFADLKLYDIPTTVERGARALGRRGVEFLNFHAAGGAAMLRRGVEGLRDGARDVSHPVPVALAVTVLTSDADTGRFPERLAAAREGGCDGVVCSAWEAGRARDAGLSSMVPGIRLAGGDVHDQSRVATPDEAIAQGATWIAVGRAVTTAPDPEAAAAEVAGLVARELSSR